MKAIVILSDSSVEYVSFQENGEPLYKLIREVISGFMENTYPELLGSDIVMIVNEEGKLPHLRLPVNKLATYIYTNRGMYTNDFIVGDVILLKLGEFMGETDVIGFSDSEVDELMKKIKMYKSEIGFLLGVIT